MKRICHALLLVALGCLAAHAQSRVGPGGGAPDPYVLQAQAGEPDGTIPSPGGYSNPNGKTLVSSVVSSPATSAVIITTWQSNIESAALGTFTAANASALNFSIYDGGLYRCANPVLGAALNTAGNGNNSANCQIADSLITAGTYSTVIMVPIAIGGTSCSDWVSGMLQQRITVTIKRLASRGLTPASGWAGGFWILAHGGETDAGNGSLVRATFATCIRNMAAAFVTAGTGTARFFVPTESMVTNVTNATVTGGQADAVASGCTTCRAGAHVDSLTTATNRQADGTHFTQTGAANLAGLDVTVITNCKNTSC